MTLELNKANEKRTKTANMEKEVNKIKFERNNRDKEDIKNKTNR